MGPLETGMSYRAKEPFTNPAHPTDSLLPTRKDRYWDRNFWAYRIFNLIFFIFLPRDAMLACNVPWFCVCSSVRPSVISRVLHQNDWTNRASFWNGGFLPLIPHCVLKAILVSPKASVISPWNFVPKSGLGKCRHCMSMVKPVDDTYVIQQSTSRGCLLHVGRL